jgi:hypothetical protein
VSTEAPVTKTSNQTKNANGRGSTYIVTKANGKKVRKAAINDVNGKRRVKTFKMKADAEDWLAEQRRARELGENTYAANPKMNIADFLDGWLSAHKMSVKPKSSAGVYRITWLKLNVFAHIGRSPGRTICFHKVRTVCHLNKFTSVIFTVSGSTFVESLCEIM